MHHPSHALALLPIFIGKAVADFLTPTYPAPVDLSSNTSLVVASWKNLSLTLDAYLKDKERAASNLLSGVENATFSVGMFSLHDPATTKLQYHYTAPEIANAKQGTQKVDADSIYRVASVSKLITTFAGLVTLTEDEWNRPLAEINPGLGQYARAHAKSLNSLYTTQWDSITPWALATQLSGVATIGLPAADLAVGAQLTGAAEEMKLLKAYGFPPVDVSDLGPCATNVLNGATSPFCPAPAGIEGVAGLPPNFLPWQTPAYSDEGFMLLAIAISNITGKPMSAIYQDSVFRPLGMTSSNDTHPTNEAELARTVISGDPALDFALETGFTTPSGGILSTIHDLSKFGIGILNHTLVPADKTRRWMKPQSHTASLSYSIGGPWEIHRYVHPTTSRITDLYTKLGDSGYYGGAVVLIPQYDAGFSMLNAGNSSTRSNAALVVLDFVTNTILPALEAQAAVEAQSNYVGTYVSTEASLNASVTIGFNKSSVPGVTSGLTVMEWNFNGTDVIAGPLFNSIRPRLEPSIPKQTPVGQTGQVAFLASVSSQALTYADAMKVKGSGVIGTWTGFYQTNGDFVFADSQRYGGVNPNMFVFDVDGEGRAVACRPTVDRIELKRKDRT